MSFGRAVATVSSLTLVSRIAGFLRDILTASFIGAGPAADAFFVALKLPNLFRRVFAEGAFSYAFVPLFAGIAEKEGVEPARRYAAQIATLLLAALGVVTALAMIFMPWLVIAVAPGFNSDPYRYQLAIDLSRITFPYLPLISLVALVGGMLNSVERFGPFAFAPVLFNATLIISLLVGQFGFHAPVTALAWGTTVSGAVQLVWMAWFLRRENLLFWPRLPQLTPPVKRLFINMGPAVIGGGVVQINAFIDVVLGSLLPTGGISHLYYSDRLYQMPLGIIGVAIGTASLPLIARRIKAGDVEGARYVQNRSFELALMFGLPAAAGLAVAAWPIVTVLFQHGAFTAQDALFTAHTTAVFGLGVPAYLLLKGLQAAFFAREDTRTPMWVGLIGMVVNAVVGGTLLHFYGAVGIAAGTTIASWVNTILLIYFLHRAGLLEPDERLLFRLRIMLLATAVMVLAILAVRAGVDRLFTLGTLPELGGLVAIMGVALIVYFGICVAFKALALSDLRSLLHRRQL